MRDWSQTPHIRMSDPCHDCGTPMTPACRHWTAWTIPTGHRKHAGRGLCGLCIRRRRDAGTLDRDLVTAGGDHA